MANSSATYNNDIRGNLPVGISYDSTRFRFFVNGKPFHNYTNAYWYWRYILKFGWTGAGDYSANGYHPALVGDFVEDIFWEREQMPLQPLTFDDIFTHSRLGNATMVDSDGLLKWGPHNLLTYSEDFSNAAWTKTNTTVAANAATAPDGTLTADRLVGSGTWLTYQSPGNVKDHTISVWVKSNTGSDQTFRFITNSSLTSADLTATSEWQLFEFEQTSTGSASGWGLTRNLAGGDADILVWGAHVYRSDLGGMAPVPLDARVAGSTTYVPTTSTAKYLPRRHNHVYDSSVAKWNLHNLITYSEDFTDASWTKSTAVMTVTANAGVSPSGQSDATLFTPDTATNIRYAGVSGFPSSDYTFSIYAKSNGGSNDQISIWLAGLTQRAVFDLGAGTVNNINLTSASIEDVGNGWYRCVGYSSTATTAARVYLQDGNAFTGNDSDGIYIWGAHLYRSDLNGMEATGSPYPTYLATTGTAVEPTLSDVSWVDAGTLIETEARTNLLTYSDDFTNAAWVYTGLSDNTPDADGYTPIEENATTFGHYFLQDSSVTVNETYTLSFDVKARENAAVQIASSTGFTSSYINFDLSSGTIGSGSLDATITEIGDGEYRVSASAVATSTTSGARFVIALIPDATSGRLPNYTGTSGNGVLIRRVQFEQGSVPGSYIPTSGSTVTRAADTSGLTIPAYSTTRTTGSELVVNGGFDADSDWTKETGWAISGGVAAYTPDTGREIRQTISTTANSVYLVGYDVVDASVGTVGVYSLESGQSTAVYEGNSVGSFSRLLVATGTSMTVRFRTNSTSASLSIDNISVKEAARIAPWPTPRVIGDELVTNGDFSTGDLTGWTDISLGTGTASASTGAARLTGTDTSNRGWVNTPLSTVVGKSYVVTFEVTADAGGVVSLGVGTSSGSVGTIDFGVSAVGVYTKTFVAPTTTMHVSFRTSGVTDMTVDNISVKEIDPLAVAIQMKGRMTYADTGVDEEVVFFRWYNNSNSRIYDRVYTVGGDGGGFVTRQVESGTGDQSYSADEFSPGINQAFNIASYHGSTFINGAVGGTALTADTTPVSLPDLEDTDLYVGYDFMGNIEEVRIWVGGITDVTSGNLLIESASS